MNNKESDKNINMHEETFLTNLLDNIYYIISSLKDLLTLLIPKGFKDKLKSFGDNVYNFIILSLMGLLFWFLKYLFQNKIMTMLKLFFTVIGVALTYFIMKFNNKKTNSNLYKKINTLCANKSNANSEICKSLNK